MDRRPAPSVAELVRRAAGGGAPAFGAAARLMSLVADDPARLPDVYQATVALAGGDTSRLLLPRLLVGVTGAPGSGKSTLTDALIRELRQRAPDRRLGVVAVDPSSPFTGGAVLGDRVRMMRHATDPMVFVRSMASRGHLGGLALGVKGVVRIMGLIGCDLVFIETVGVGQSEVEVAAVADLVMIVMAPGQGDGVQLLKAGLMEIGDLFVVNKADRPDAARLHAELLGVLHVAGQARAAHHPRREQAGPRPDDDPDDDPGGEEDSAPLLTRRPGAFEEALTFLVSAEQGQGVARLADTLEELAASHAERWQRRRQASVEAEVRDAVLEEAAARIRETLAGGNGAGAVVGAILEGALSVREAALRLLEKAGGCGKDEPTEARPPAS